MEEILQLAVALKGSSCDATLEKNYTEQSAETVYILSDKEKAEIESTIIKGDIIVPPKPERDKREWYQRRIDGLEDNLSDGQYDYVLGERRIMPMFGSYSPTIDFRGNISEVDNRKGLEDALRFTFTGLNLDAGPIQIEETFNKNENWSLLLGEHEYDPSVAHANKLRSPDSGYYAAVEFRKRF